MRLAILVSAILPAVAAGAATLPVFIGTGGGGEAKGIYRMDFNPQTGRLTTPELAVEYANPGFLALHPRLPVVLAIGQPKQPFPDRTGAVAAFAIGEDHSLSFLGEASSGGRGPCHLAVDATGGTVAIANYGDGNITTVRLAANGAPQQPVSVITNTGSGPHPRQEGPHAHGVYFDRANKHLFVPDLGLDRVLVYRFDAATSELTAHDPPALPTAPGAGPRHMAFSPDERHAYVINELDQTVLVAGYEPETGNFSPRQTLTTLPAAFDEPNKTSEIEVHPNGRFVYGSNRGHESIVVYARDPETGELTFVQHAPCAGKTPRHFKIDPTGRWLLCAHQDSHTISAHPIDPASGRLGPAVSSVEVPSPICVLFPEVAE